jgi:BirA family transcriptional regulator, biotin operon repressor / biotin---[acetyl-CoA-carboxylase] ligase
MIIGSNLIFKKNLPSTNTYAADLLKKNSPQEGTIIQTNFQSAGRGQTGNKWESEDGNNLLISIILYPSTVNPSEQFTISMAVSLGICDFVTRFSGDSSVKWPNDIYVKNDKIAGILIENSVMGAKIENSIVGIGLNINQISFKSDAPNPVSLKLVTGADYILPECLAELASDLDIRYKQVIAEEFQLLKDDYASKLYRINEWADFIDKNGRFEGKIVSVTDSGKLVIERKPGKQTEYSFKEVEFII